MIYSNNSLKVKMRHFCAFIILVVIGVSGSLNAQVPVLVKDINPGKYSSSPQFLTEFKGKLYFGARNANGLWMTDGTDVGTVQTDGSVSIGNDFVSELTVHNNQLFFNTNLDLSWWKTAGGIDNAVKYSDNFKFVSGVSYDSVTLAETDLVFAAQDLKISGAAINLYCSNGNMYDAIGNFASDSNGSSPKGFKKLNSQLIFSAIEGDTGRELYSTDATTLTTYMLKDIDSGNGDGLSESSGLEDGVVLGDKVCFPGSSEEPYGTKLWCTDGTTAGTVAVYDEDGVANGALIDYDSTKNLTVFNDFIYFFASAGESSRLQLWRATTSWRDPTVPVHPTQITFDPELTPSKSDNENDNECSESFSPIVVDGSLYFSREDNYNGCELWKSDGTTTGTKILKDINTGLVGSYPVLMDGDGDELYFTALKEGFGEELWHTNGKTSGTLMVSDLNPGPEGSIVDHEMLVYNGEPYFVADDGVHGQELYKITFPVANLIFSSGFE